MPPASWFTPTSAARRSRAWRSSGSTAVARGYANLEYDLATGARGSRTRARRAPAHGADRRRGRGRREQQRRRDAADPGGPGSRARGAHLARRAGGDRRRLPVPDVMAQSGALLREVGTTNRTRVSDYTAAAGPTTALFLRVHPSNFRIEGFTERALAGGLVAAGRAAACRSSRTSAPATSTRPRPGNPRCRLDRRGRGPGLLQRRQAARRPAGGIVLGRRCWSIACARIR